MFPPFLEKFFDETKFIALDYTRMSSKKECFVISINYIGKIPFQKKKIRFGSVLFWQPIRDDI